MFDGEGYGVFDGGEFGAEGFVWVSEGVGVDLVRRYSI